MKHKIISQKDAIAQGLKTYYTGKSCKYGHLSLRKVSGGQCIECVIIYNKTFYPSRRSYRKIRDKALNHLGGVCTSCGNSDRRVLQIDHVYSDGARVRTEEDRDSHKLCHNVLKDSSRYQLLCANCNFIKRFTEAEIIPIRKTRGELAKLRKRIFTLFGQVCSHCGNTDVRCLQLDHVYGGGKQEARRIGAKGICYKAFKNPTQYQILCANCNWIKRDMLKEVAK
jgi:hypothetical protein